MLRTSGAGVAALMHDFSIEATPRETHHADEWQSLLEPGTRIYIPRLPKASFAETVAAARRLRRAGFRPVPHLAARTIPNERDLCESLSLLTDAGVDDVLVIAGSQSQPAGEFESTMQLLDTGAFEEAGIERIGVAGHPEGHPYVSETDLRHAIDWKNTFAASSGVKMYIVTQFFFDAAPVIAWEKGLRERGNRLPIDVGFHGMTNAASLFKYAVSCGIGASIKALGERADVLRTLAVRSPEDLLIEIAQAKERDPSSLFTSAHFYPLGAFAPTAKWAAELSQPP